LKESSKGVDWEPWTIESEEAGTIATIIDSDNISPNTPNNEHCEMTGAGTEVTLLPVLDN
jgi:hypothetical protein